jgi:prepilin-type N-terminal cleavage/methylation domain-containing protein
MKLKTNKGFTLVEIMIVVIVIGLLAAMAIPAFQKVRQVTVIKHVESCEVYQCDNCAHDFYKGIPDEVIAEYSKPAKQPVFRADVTSPTDKYRNINTENDYELNKYKALVNSLEAENRILLKRVKELEETLDKSGDHSYF